MLEDNGAPMPKTSVNPCQYIYGCSDPCYIEYYDVLEHVLNVKQFLSNCYRALKPGGVMICEVPNLLLYPDNLLLQEFEHVNHFTISSLSLIAEKVGFSLIEFDNVCSRPY